MKLSGQPCERRQPLAPLGQRAFDQRGCELQPGERALQLVEVELTLTPDAGWSLRWLAPPADARGRRLLPAGQAAVVELERLPR